MGKPTKMVATVKLKDCKQILFEGGKPGEIAVYDIKLNEESDTMKAASLLEAESQIRDRHLEIDFQQTN